MPQNCYVWEDWIGTEVCVPLQNTDPENHSTHNAILPLQIASAYLVLMEHFIAIFNSNVTDLLGIERTILDF